MVQGVISGNGMAGGLIGSLIGGTVENSCFIDTVGNSNVLDGICGYLYGSIVNCYSACTIADNNSKIYYNVNNSDFSGSGATWTLNTPPYINGLYRTDLVDALNAWVDANNTDGRYKHWAADTNMVNDGYPVFESISLPAVSSHDTVVAQGFYSWHGMVFTADTVLTDTISTIFGYDSVVTYHIFVTQAQITEISLDTCSSYLWNGEIYTESGDYVQTLPSANDADSVVILHLTINPLTGVDEQRVCGNSGFTWIDGITYVADNNTAIHTLQTADGCDSLVTLHLTLGQNTTSDTTAIACESFTWYNNTYTESGDYQLTMSNAAGCDSIVTLHLTINNSNTGDTIAIACDSFDWYEHKDITQSCENLTNTFTNANGCDSVVTLHLIIHHTTTSDTTATACGSFTWHGETYTESGDYSYSLTNVEDCDSIVTLHLTINPIPEVAITGNTNICPGGGTILTATGADSYLWSNYSTDASISVNTFGVYNVIGYTSAGCYNSASVTVLVAQPPVITITGDSEICAGHTGVITAHGGNTYLWSNGSTDSTMTVSGADSWQVIGYDANGCSSTANVTVSVWQPATTSFSATACDSYTWNGSVYTQSGDYTQTFQTVHGCDSVVTLHLTIYTTYHEYLHVSACGSYVWNGMTYSASGDYDQTFTTIDGCDSIITLHLTIHPIPEVTIVGNTNICPGGGTLLTATGADNYLWSTGSTNSFIPVNMFGIYSVTGTNSAGCSNATAVTVLVTQSPVITITGETDICAGESTTLSAHGGNTYLWSNGSTDSTMTVSGADSWQVIGYDANGCSSMADVTVNVWQPATTSFSASACDSYTWNDSVYTKSGDYTQSFQTVHGCDSIVTLHLTINQPTTGDTTAVACESFTWYGVTLTESTELTRTFTNAAGCDSIVTLHLTIHPTPTVVISGNQNICETDPVSLTASVITDGFVPENLHFTWYESGLIRDNMAYGHADDSVYVEYWYPRNEPYHFSVQVSIGDDFSCPSQSGEYLVYVHPLPNVYVSATETSICVGGTTTLMAVVSNMYDNNISYSWSDGNFGSSNTISPNFSGSFTFTVTATLLPSGCASIDEITINVNDIPETPVVTADNTLIYDGGPVTLSVTNPAADAIYTWYRNGILIDGATNYVLTDYLTTIDGDVAFYNYTVRTQLPMSGCVSNLSANTVVTVNPTPTAVVSVVGDTVFCEGGTSVLHANVTPLDNSNPTYQWYKDGELIPGANHPIYVVSEPARMSPYSFQVVVSANGAYTVTAYAPSITIVSQPVANISLMPEYSDTVYDGASTAIIANVTGGYGGTAYQWYHNGILLVGESSQVLYINSLSYGGNDIYTVMVAQTGTNCTNTASADINTLVTVLPSYTVNVEGTGSVCDGDTVTLTATVSNAAEGDVLSYQWYRETNEQAMPVPGANSASYSTTDLLPGDVYVFYVVVNSSYPGSAAVASAGYAVVVHALPNITIDGNNSISYGQNTTLTASGAMDFGWSSGDDTYSITVSPTITTTYTVTGTSIFGCTDTAVVTVTVNPIVPTVITDIVSEITTNSAICGGNITSHGGAEVTERGICWSTLQNPTISDLHTTDGSGMDSFVSNITGLVPNTTYYVRAYATNSVGTAYGEEMVFTTLCDTVFSAFNATSCDSYVWNGSLYSESGDYQQTFAAANGCDSVVTLHLTIHNPEHNTVTETACGSFTWNGTEYTVSGDYTYSHADANGCTQVDTLHLTIHNPVHTAVTETACESFTWNGTEYTVSGDYIYSHADANGCTQVDTLHLTIFYNESSEFSITTEDSCYTWNDQSYCTSGDYTQTLQSVHGCDSVVTLHLTITVGVDDYDRFDFKVYPNPTSNIVNVQCTMCNVQFDDMELHVVDAYGRLLAVVRANNDSPLQTTQIDLTQYAKGVYFVKAVADEKVIAVKKIVKQ